MRLCDFLSPNDCIIYTPVQLPVTQTPAKTTSAVWSADERQLNWRHSLLSIPTLFILLYLSLLLFTCTCVQVYVLLIILWNSNRFFFVCHKWDPSWLIPDLSYWKSENRRQNYQRVQSLLSFKINHQNTKMPSKTHSNKISWRLAGLIQSSNHDNQARKALEQVKMRVNLWTGAPENGDLSFSWLMQFEPLNVMPTNVHNSAL